MQKPKLPGFEDVMSSHFESDWEPTQESVKDLRAKLAAVLAPEALDHGMLCATSAAGTYVAARTALARDSASNVEPSERREAIAEWLSEEFARFERLSHDLAQLKNVAVGFDIADRAYVYLRTIEPRFFFNWSSEVPSLADEGQAFIAEVDHLRAWINERRPALETAVRGMAEPGQKESTPERTLGVTLGFEWDHLKKEHGLRASRKQFFEAVRELLIQNGVPVDLQTEQLVKAYDNHHPRRGRRT